MHCLIPNRVLIILNGKARLLCTYKEKLLSLVIFGPDMFVGLASLLRGEACEEVTAAEEVDAWSIPDTLVAELYSNKTGLKVGATIPHFLQRLQN